MHIPEGILNPTICLIMLATAAVFLAWAWKKAKETMPRSFIPLIAISSAITLLIQMVEFPVAGGGSTWHIMGGTAVTMILGPYGAMISLTIVLLIQALLGDGGITSFGANVFNMAVISALSFFVAKFLLNGSFSKKRLGASLFVAAWLSNILTALSVGVQIGIAPLVGTLGGIGVTVPTMLFWYILTGLAEAFFTVPIVLSLSQVSPTTLHGLSMLRNTKKQEETSSGNSSFRYALRFLRFC